MFGICLRKSKRSSIELAFAELNHQILIAKFLHGAIEADEFMENIRKH